MPTGVSWLIGCLLSLGIRTTDYRAHWLETPTGSRPAPDWVVGYLKTFLPMMQSARAFDFEPGIEVFWGHQLSYTHYPARKTILSIRDPRDTVYSQFRREVHEGLYQDSEAELLSYLRSPEIHLQFFPHLFDLPPADTLAVFALLCLRLVPPEQLLVLRFEDVKRDPAGQLRRVLDFLGLRRSEAQIQAALEASDTRHFQELSDSLTARTGIRKLISRGGQVEEWRQTVSAAALACFRGPAQELIAELDYPPLPPMADQPPSVEPALREQASALIGRFHQLMAEGAAQQAQALLQQSFRASEQNLVLRDLIAGQMMGLLWTRAIMGPARSHLPVAARMARFFFDFNARYGAWPQLRQAAAKILNPAHALHTLGPGSPLAGPEGGAGLPSQKLIYFNPRLSAPGDFSRAAAEALASGLKFLLWRRPGVQLEGQGLLQLCDLLHARNEALAVLPARMPGQPDLAAFRFAAYQQQVRQGAEFETVSLAELPDCALFRCKRLAGLALQAPIREWSAGQTIYRALGVLATDAG